MALRLLVMQTRSEGVKGVPEMEVSRYIMGWMRVMPAFASEDRVD